MKQSKIIEISVNDLKPYPGNPRKISADAKEKLKKKIETFGDVNILTIDEDYQVVGGNQRLNAMIDLGFDKIQVRQLIGYSEAEIKQINLALNNNDGEWDGDLLDDFVLSVINEPDFDIDLTGLKDEDFEMPNLNDAGKEDIEDEIPEIKEKSVIKTGDLIELNQHRLLCGDCTIKENIEKLMNGEKADIVLTDPPYGMNLNTDYSSMVSKKNKEQKGQKFKKVIGDDIEYNPTHIFNSFNYCKEIFLWGADYYINNIDRNSKNDSWFVWDKRITENFDKMYGSCFELCWSKNKHKREIIRVKWANYFGIETQDIKKRFHPTQKPIQVSEFFINKFSNINDIIIDLFLGSGSTLIAAEKTGRKCYGTEIDNHYCQVIIERYLNYTEKENIVINGQDVNWKNYKDCNNG